MIEHFGGMLPLEEMGPYIAWHPPPVPPVRGWPGSFDASLAAPGIATPQTAGNTPLGGTPHETALMLSCNTTRNGTIVVVYTIHPFKIIKT
jgi:hypothetical protein